MRWPGPRTADCRSHRREPSSSRDLQDLFCRVGGGVHLCRLQWMEWNCAATDTAKDASACKEATCGDGDDVGGGISIGSRAGEQWCCFPPLEYISLLSQSPLSITQRSGSRYPSVVDERG